MGSWGLNAMLRFLGELVRIGSLSEKLTWSASLQQYWGNYFASVTCKTTCSSAWQ